MEVSIGSANDKAHCFKLCEGFGCRLQIRQAQPCRSIAHRQLDTANNLSPLMFCSVSRLR
jgi:hypothetical protein